MHVCESSGKKQSSDDRRARIVIVVTGWGWGGGRGRREGFQGFLKVLFLGLSGGSRGVSLIVIKLFICFM